MERIVRADAGWEQVLADALAGAARPIPLDERLLPRTPDGKPGRRRFARGDLPAPRPAATLLALYPDDAGELVIPLTVRHGDLRTHAGEVSLPGGVVDATDASREAAALREAWEEIGLAPESVRIVGELDDVWIPVSNFELRPFVGTVARRPALVAHDAEVTAIVELPLRALWDADVLGEEEFSTPGLVLRAGAYRFGGVRIWGATALTLGMLAHVLEPAGR
ncbi:MAG TPA: CoA pyrophosphatase [Candidatus Binatia bacterium]|nr:CoA pyrophosphatase [Candidatus Binatia bacterium]